MPLPVKATAIAIDSVIATFGLVGIATLTCDIFVFCAAQSAANGAICGITGKLTGNEVLKSGLANVISPPAVRDTVAVVVVR